jgi:hypothetical protein
VLFGDSLPFSVAELVPMWLAGCVATTGPVAASALAAATALVAATNKVALVAAIAQQTGITSRRRFRQPDLGITRLRLMPNLSSPILLHLWDTRSGILESAGRSGLDPK